MNKTKYLQYDSKWSSLGYPKSPCTIGNSGCGEVSVVNCIIEMEKYKNYTPKTIQAYCKQFAEPSCNGTYWSGIPTMMQHYGLTEVKEHSDMPSLFTELAKGDRVAIYLMGSRLGGSKGVRWTSSGHFVCSVDYKKKDGKNYIYVKDSYSNSALRNGWLTYEENMRGAVLKVWSGKLNGKLTDGQKMTTEVKVIAKAKKEVPSKGDRCKVIRKKGLWLYDKPSKKGKHLLRIDYGTVFTVHDTKVGKTSCFAKIKKQNKWGWILIYDKNGVYCENITDKKSYTGEYPNIDRAKMLVDKAVELAWKKGTATSKYKYPSGSATDQFKKALDKVYPNRKSWGKAARVGASCDVFVGTSVLSAGLDDKFPRGLREQLDYKPKNFTRKEYKNVAPIDKSASGDIVMFLYDGGGHIVIRGNGYYYEANYNIYFGHTNTSLSRLKNKFKKVVVLTPKNYLAKGDTGSEVKKLQKYLNWYNPKLNLAVDGDFDTATKKAVISFQENELGKDKGDGIVGEVTLKAMKKAKK